MRSKRWGWIAAAVGVAWAAVFLPPLIRFPKVVKTSTDPSGPYAAEIVVRPASGDPLDRLLALSGNSSVDIYARVRSTNVSSYVEERRLTNREDCEFDATCAEISWDHRGSVWITSRRNEVQTFRLPP